MKLIYKLIIIISLAPLLFAGGFEDLGNSARTASMGGAFIAVADAPYSLFYNPAGIYDIDNLSISTSFANLYPGITGDNLYYISLSSVIPINIIGKFGAGITHLNSNLWKENTLVLTYAREIYGSLSIGGSFKLLRWSAEAAPGESGLDYTGFTFDLGAHYSVKEIIPQSELRFGITAQNLTQPSIANNGSSDANLPLKLGAGFAYLSRVYGYLITADFIKEGDELMLRTGTEFNAFSQDLLGVSTGFLIRLGYNGLIGESNYRQNELSGGFGLVVEKLTIDYAYLFPLELTNVGGSHKLSLSYNF